MAAYTVLQLIDLLEAEVANQNAKTRTVLRVALVDELRTLSSNRTLQFEVSTTFNTVAGTSTYGSPSVPAAVLEITRLYYKIGGRNYEIPGPVSVDDARFKYANQATTAEYPLAFSWNAEQLILAPAPAGVITLYLDYFKNGTRDDVTGNEILITSASDAYTNDWLDGGSTALRYGILARYFKSPMFADQERAAFMDIQKMQALRALQREFLLKKEHGGQADPWLGGPLAGVAVEDNGHYYPR